MRKRLLVMLAVMLMVVFALAACAPQTDATGEDAADTGDTTDQGSSTDDATDDTNDVDETADEGGEVIIGSIQDLSGAMAVAGNMTTWAVERAVDDINADGGINGKTLKVITYDCKLDPNEGINAYNRLVDEGAVAIVGPGLSNIGIPIASVAEEKKVAFVGQFMDERATINEQTGEVWNYMFLAEPSCLQQAQIMASYSIEELKVSSVGILYDSSNAYATSHAGPFEDYMKENGVEVVGVETFGADAKDYKAQLSKLIAANPDGIYIPNYVNTNSLAYVQARQLGYEGYIIGNNTYTPPFTTLVEGTEIENLVFLYNLDMYGDSVRHLTEDYIAEVGEDPAFNIAFGYDDVMIIANALRNVSDVTDTVEIAKYIESNTIDVETASGKITLNPETHRPAGQSRRKGHIYQ
jgi:branched-chain amino acid transport system substrate-binding protein